MSLEKTTNDIYELLNSSITRYEDKINILCVLFNLRPAYLVGDWDKNTKRDLQLRKFIKLYGNYFHLNERYTQPESMPNIRLIYSNKLNPWIETFEIDNLDEFYGKALGFDCEEPSFETNRYSVNFSIYVNNIKKGLLFNQMCEYGKLNYKINKHKENDINNILKLINIEKIEVKMKIIQFPSYQNKQFIEFITKYITLANISDDDYNLFVNYYKKYLQTYDYSIKLLNDKLNGINDKQDVLEFIHKYGSLLIFILVNKNESEEKELDQETLDFIYNTIVKTIERIET